MRDFISDAMALRMSWAVTPKKIATALQRKGGAKQQELSYFTPQTVRASCIQLGVRSYKDFNDYLTELHTLTLNAVQEGAHFVVFPEYIGLLALSIPIPELNIWVALQTEDVEQIQRFRQLIRRFYPYLYDAYVYTFSTLARLMKIYIAAGSALFYEQGSLYSRCVVFGPDGEAVGAQDKLSPGRFDRMLDILPGRYINPAPTALGPLGIVIGSDAAFFESFHIAAVQGTRIFAVPGVANALVPPLLQCRAQESGAYILHAACTHDSQPPQTGVYAPFHVSEDGIFAQALDNAPQAFTRRINLDKLDMPPVSVEANPLFAQDYLRSYRYCGRLPVIK